MSLTNLDPVEREKIREHQLECIQRDKVARAWLKKPREQIQAHLDRTGDEKLKKAINLLMKYRGQACLIKY